MITRSMAKRADASAATVAQPNITPLNTARKKPADTSINDAEPPKKERKTDSTAARKQALQRESTDEKPAKNQIMEAPTAISAKSDLAAASPQDLHIDTTEERPVQSIEVRIQADEVNSIETQVSKVRGVATEASKLSGEEADVIDTEEVDDEAGSVKTEEDDIEAGSVKTEQEDTEADATDIEDFDMANWGWDDPPVPSNEVNGGKQTEKFQAQAAGPETHVNADNYQHADHSSNKLGRKRGCSEPIDDSRVTKRLRHESLDNATPSLPAAPHRFWQIREMVDNVARIIAESSDSRSSPDPSRMQRQAAQEAKANSFALGGTNRLLYLSTLRWKARDLTLEKDGLNVAGPCFLHSRENFHDHCFECHERELDSVKRIEAITANSKAPTVRSLTLSGDWSMECLGRAVELARDQKDPLITSHLGSIDQTTSLEYAQLGKAWLTGTLKSCRNLHTLIMKGVLPEMITQTMEALEDSGLQITTLGLGTDNSIHEAGLYSFLDDVNVSSGRSRVNYAAIFASLETIQFDFEGYLEHSHYSQEGPLSHKIERLFKLIPRLDHLIIKNQCASHHLKSLVNASSRASGLSLINTKVRSATLENLLTQRKAHLRLLHLEEIGLEMEYEHRRSKSWSSLLDLITHCFGTLKSLTLGCLTYDWLACDEYDYHTEKYGRPRRFAHEPFDREQDPRDVCDDAFGPLMSLNQDDRHRWIHFREWLAQYQRLSNQPIVTTIEEGICHSEYNEARCVGRTKDGMRCYASTYPLKKYYNGGLVWFCDHHRQDQDSFAKWPYRQGNRW